LWPNDRPSQQLLSSCFAEDTTNVRPTACSCCAVSLLSG